MTQPHPFPRRRRWLLPARAAFIACSLACASAERARPQRPAASALPLPANLDVAIRVDATILGADLGEEPTRRFLLDALSEGEPVETAKWLERSLARAALLWVAIPMRETGESSAVLVLRGSFASLDAAAGEDRPWKRSDSGIETVEFADGSADGYVRAYRLPGDDTLVWSSRADLASVELALRGEASPSMLRPPERGAVSIAARPEGLLERYASRYPELVEQLRGIRRIEAFAEPTSGMWRADLTLDFASPEQASEVTRLAERLKQALGKRRCAVGVLARAMVVSNFERDVRVQAVLLGPEVEAVKACLLGGACCA